MKSQLAIITGVALAAKAGLPPNASDVVKLTHSGVSEEVAASCARNVSTPFHLSADDILGLKAQGVSSQIIVAMLNRDAQLRDQARPTTPPPPAQPAPVYDQPPPTTYYPQEAIPVSPGPDYNWSPGYWGYNGAWIGGAWLYGGVGLGLGWPWGYGWGGCGRGYYGGYGRGFHGGGGSFGGGSHGGGFGGGGHGAGGGGHR